MTGRGWVHQRHRVPAALPEADLAQHLTHSQVRPHLSGAPQSQNHPPTSVHNGASGAVVQVEHAGCRGDELHWRARVGLCHYRLLHTARLSSWRSAARMHMQTAAQPHAAGVLIGRPTVLQLIKPSQPPFPLARRTMARRRGQVSASATAGSALARPSSSARLP